MIKKIKDLSYEEIINLCQARSNCEHCPYKMFSTVITDMNGETSGYSVCLPNVYAFINDNQIDLETGEISKTEEYIKEQAELERAAKELIENDAKNDFKKIKN